MKDRPRTRLTLYQYSEYLKIFSKSHYTNENKRPVRSKVYKAAILNLLPPASEDRKKDLGAIF